MVTRSLNERTASVVGVGIGLLLRGPWSSFPSVAAGRREPPFSPVVELCVSIIGCLTVQGKNLSHMTHRHKGLHVAFDPWGAASSQIGREKVEYFPFSVESGSITA